jgi:hypothetical protein
VPTKSGETFRSNSRISGRRSGHAFGLFVLANRKLYVMTHNVPALPGSAAAACVCKTPAVRPSITHRDIFTCKNPEFMLI